MKFSEQWLREWVDPPVSTDELVEQLTMAGLLNDGSAFRCNAGVGSWTPDWTRVRLDVQDAAGNIVASEIFDVPPYGHIQRRLRASGDGGSLVFYLEDGPDDALVFPYATVINQRTGDASFLAAEPSRVGVSVEKALQARAGRPSAPGASKRDALAVRRKDRATR